MSDVVTQFSKLFTREDLEAATKLVTELFASSKPGDEKKKDVSDFLLSKIQGTVAIVVDATGEIPVVGFVVEPIAGAITQSEVVQAKLREVADDLAQIIYEAVRALTGQK